MEAIMTRDFACAREKPAKPEDLARLFLIALTRATWTEWLRYTRRALYWRFRRGRLPSAPRRSGRFMKHFWLTARQ